MPIAIEDYQSRSAASELTKAGVASLWFATGTELGFNYIMGPALKGAGKVVKGIGRGLGKLPVRNIASFTGRSMRRAASMYSPQARDLVGGAVRGTYKSVSWLYKHPVGFATSAAALGVGLAMLDPHERISNDEFASPSIVEAMGGSSQYGVRQMMETMNASGDIVLGMNSRR